MTSTRALGSASKLVFAALVTIAIVFVDRRVDAHTIGLSTGEYTARGASVVAKLAFARAEVAALAPALDANRDGHVAPVEVADARGLLRSKILARIHVTSGGAACIPFLSDAALTEEDGLLVSGRWDCASDGERFEIELRLLDDLGRGHRHVARTVSSGATHDEVLLAAQNKVEVAREHVAAPPQVAAVPAQVGSPRPWAFFKMGIEHILGGYDHLLFILGLVLARAPARSLVTIVTAFTIAHSVTLALAVLGVWAPSAHVVEPAIALSIAYVGIENLFVKDASKRWRITFPFGLVHGFGFAGALREIALPQSAVPTALLSFNLGVEAGQLAVLAVLVPLLVVLRDKSWFQPHGVRVASALIAVAGGVWFLRRVML